MIRQMCLLLWLWPLAAVAAEPKVIVRGLKNPTAVCATTTGRVFVSTADGIAEVKDGKATKVVDLANAGSLVAFQQAVFAVAGNAVHRLNLTTGKAEVWAAAKDFPTEPKALAGITVDERGLVYVAEANQPKNALYAIGMKFSRPGQPTVRGEIKKVAELPGGDHGEYALACEAMTHLLAFESHGTLLRVNVTNGKLEELSKEFKGGGHISFDQFGRLFVLTADGVSAFPRPDAKPVQVLAGRKFGLAVNPVSRQLLFTDKASLLAIPSQIPGWEVDESPLPFETEFAFTDLKWTGWDSGEDTGRVIPLRPMVLTHAGDGSGRTFVATQHGVIHIVEKGAKQTKVFLDLQKKVLYKDNENEQGLLGLAFHPQYKTNGEFYVFYTDRARKLENVLSRFKVSKSDPNVADPASEEELLRVSHKYWNHDGGTVAFGPDGYLYLVLGDGGSANDPDDNGQNTDTLLGKILRLDVGKRGEKTAYAIPADNPFVGKSGFRPEIYATGVRNPWRLSFDRKTGQGWFGDVGQNLYEEINLLTKGANYGWRRRESFHPFGKDGHGVRAEYAEPIWEYHHDVGKSITAGHVYRGQELPALEGYFLYADYVSGKVWGLKYDESKKRVVANRPIKGSSLPTLSFGEDEAGELYLLTYSATGKGLSRLKASK